MNTPKVSVVIPIYNAEEHLRECLDSVLGQTLREIEVILVNDGSQDGSGDVCEEYKRKDSRVRVVYQQNAGAGMARNQGIALAAGEFIAFVDSDDYLEPEMYEVMYTRAVQVNADYCCCGWRRVKNGVVHGERGPREDIVATDAASLKDVYLRHLGTEPTAVSDSQRLTTSSCNSLFSATVIREQAILFKSERECLSEDALFKTEYLRHSTGACVLKDIYYNYRLTNDSLSRRGGLENMDKLNNLYHIQLQTVAQTPFYEEAKRRIQRSIFMLVRVNIKLTCTAMSYREARKTLAGICDAPVQKEILSTYPWRVAPLKYRAFYYCIAHRLLWPLYVLGRLGANSTIKQIQHRFRKQV